MQAGLWNRLTAAEKPKKQKAKQKSEDPPAATAVK